jgi:hypothetical protein
MAGASLISNSMARFYKRNAIKAESNLEERKAGLLDTTFADCTETGLRHLFNLVLWDGKKFNIENFENNLRKKAQEQNFKWEPTSAFLNMKEWFYGEQQKTRDKANNRSIETRSAWNAVVADLNSTCQICRDFGEKEHNFRKVYYHKDFKKTSNSDSDKNYNELHPGYINIINAIEHIIGQPLEVFVPQEEFSPIDKNTHVLIKESQKNPSESYKKAYKDYVKSKMEIFFKLAQNPDYDFKVENLEVGDLKKGEYEDGNPYDLFFKNQFNTLSISGKIKTAKIDFKIKSKSSHCAVNLPSNKQKFLSINTDIPWVNAYLKNTKEDFYKIYACGVVSDYQKVQDFIKNLLSLKEFDPKKDLSQIQLAFSQAGLDDEHSYYFMREILRRTNENILDYLQKTESVCGDVCRVLSGEKIYDFSSFNQITGTLFYEEKMTLPEKVEILSILNKKDYNHFRVPKFLNSLVLRRTTFPASLLADSLTTICFDESAIEGGCEKKLKLEQFDFELCSVSSFEPFLRSCAETVQKITIRHVEPTFPRY